MKYLEYKERKIHGTFDFPLEFYHVVPSHPRYDMSYHWHVEYEIIRILKGEILLTLNEKEFLATTGDILFIYDGVLHGGLPKDCVYECIVFDMPSLLKNITFSKKEIQNILSHSWIITPHIQDKTTPLHHTMWNLFDAMQRKNPGYEFVVLGCFYQYLGIILEGDYYSKASLLTPKNNKRILQLKKAISLIESSYHSYISLEDLAMAAGMNAKYFCRFFQEMTHRTPIDYLNYYRVERACFQLATSDDSITDVGLNCGFNDSSYFIKTFKKYKGVTPKKYLNAPL